MKYVYAYYNTLGAFHGDIFTTDHEPKDFLPLYTQSLYSQKIEVLESLKEDDLYCLGQYDNIVGSIIPCRDFICHVSELVDPIIMKRSSFKKEIIDGKKDC